MIGTPPDLSEERLPASTRQQLGPYGMLRGPPLFGSVASLLRPEGVGLEVGPALR